MVVKNMDIWAISGDYQDIEATQYNNSNTNQKQDSSFWMNYKKEYSLPLYTSLHNNIICIDEYKYEPFPWFQLGPVDSYSPRG